MSIIHQIPLELLVRILDLALGSSRRLHNAQNLLAVCRAWNHAITNTPSLWYSIECRHSRRLIQKAIELSAPYPIDFVYPDNGLGDLGSYSPSIFMEDALPVVERWRTLSLDVQRPSELKPLETRSAPLLESLSLGVAHDEWAEEDRAEPVDLFEGHAPRLVEISLTGKVPMKWGSDILVGLRSLYLSGMGSWGPLMADLMLVFSRSPSLEELVVDMLDSADSLPQHDLELVELPLLEACSLFTVSDEKAHYLLSHINSEICQEFDISIYPDTTTYPTVVEVIKRCLQVVAPVVKTAHGKISFTFHTSPSYFSCSVDRIAREDRSYRIDFTTPPDGAAAAHLRYIVDSLSNQLHDFEVTVYYSDTSSSRGEPWISSCLSQLPNLTGLSMNSETPSRPIIKYLSTPVEGTLCWPHPKLTCLSLGWDSASALPDLLQMIRNRYGIKAEESSSTQEKLPAPFKMLTIHSFLHDEEVWAEIQSIVGEGQCKVESPI